jgi:4-oxalocrotonate tautomerase
MPNISIEGPVIKDINKKKILVQELTDAVTKAYGLPHETIVVIIKENSPENVGVGGKLLIDRMQSEK